MQTEFRAIVHGEYGPAEDVLRLAKRQFNSKELGPDDVLVHVTARPASVLIKAGRNSLKAPMTTPVYTLQNAASGVGRLLTQLALDIFLISPA